MRVDGALCGLLHRARLVQSPGECVTLVPAQMHRFHGRGLVIAGEVIQTDDHHSDTVFLKPAGRFAAVVEDAPARFALWSDLDGLASCAP